MSSALRGLATAAMAMMLMPPAASAGTRVDWSAVRQTNQAPTATIHQPTSTTTYRVGDVISYAGSATDPEDGSIGSLSWEIAVHRCSNSLCDPPVVVQTATGPNGTVTIPNDRGRDSFYTLALTATDSGGLQDTRSVQINPRTAQVTLLTEPPGLKLERDGTAVDAPLVVTATIGSTFSVGAPTPQGGLVFSNWTGGGSRQHDVVVGETNMTATARFRFPHPTWSLGLNGGASQARVEHHPELNVTGDWTVEAWFKVVDGTLRVRAPTAMLGYLNAPSPFDDEGWMDTEDLVEVDGEYMRILGRQSEIINVGGTKVYPTEVENVLMGMDNIRDVTVYGEPHPIVGRAVVALVNVDQPEDPAELTRRMRAFCRDKLDRFKIPVKVVVDDQALINARGKKVRRVLQAAREA